MIRKFKNIVFFLFISMGMLLNIAQVMIYTYGDIDLNNTIALIVSGLLVMFFWSTSLVSILYLVLLLINKINKVINQRF